MPIKIILFLFVTVALSACSHKKLDTSLQSLKGQNIDVAINHLGIPDDKFTLQDKEVYIWGREQTVRVRSPIGTYGSVGYGSRGGGFGGVGIVFGSPHSSYADNSFCQIKIVTDHNQIIETIERDSAGRGCSKYNAAFENNDPNNS
jgi:hypothetical protein